MKIRDMAQISLLLAIGFILRMIVPGYGAGMKPDLMLAMVFIIILMRRDFKSAILAGTVTEDIRKCCESSEFISRIKITGVIPKILR